MWADPTATDGASNTLILEAVRLASRLTSADGQLREASCFALHSDVLTCIASSGPGETQARGPYRTSEHAAFDRAITTREIVDDDAQVVVPVAAHRQDR